MKRKKKVIKTKSVVKPKSGKTLPASKTEPLQTFVLLDRSGSMMQQWSEAVRSVNTYVSDLQKDINAHPEDGIVLAVFDMQDMIQFDVVRDVKLNAWIPLGESEVTPRGTTPLLDSLIHITTMAEKRNVNKTVLVVMTDGYENASREATKEQVKAALDRFKTRNWQVVFLGANFDAFDQSMQVGGMAQATISSTPQGLVGTLHATATHTVAYRATGDAIAYTQQNRSDSGEAEVTGKK